MEYQQTPEATPPIVSHVMPPPIEHHIPSRAKTWLLESILVAILGCLPFGIIGIVYAIKVNSLHDQTRYKESRHASKIAKRWVMIGLTIGILNLIFIGIMVYIASMSNINLPGSQPLYF